MLDIGWSELILIGVVALIVIGPKDLPDMFRQLGRFTAKMRSMARDFSRAMEQAASESGVKDVANDLKSIATPQSLGMTAMKDAAAKFEKWDPLKNAATPSKAAAPAAATLASAAAPAASAAASAASAATPAAAVGPETQALLDRQAARQAIVAESTQRLRALNAARPTATPAADAPAAAARPAPRAKAATPARPAGPAPAAKTADKTADKTAEKTAAKAATRTAAKTVEKTSGKPPARRKTKKADEA